MTVSTLAERRSQAERSSATRRRILDAAFESLDELGYAATTTSEVCRRAGVSRGTLLHHYPTTADLVTAAADDIFARRLEAFRAAYRKAPEQARASTAIALLWSILSGPTYYAWLEIVVMSRTDRVLRRKVRAVMDRFSAAVTASYAEMFPPPADAPFDPSLPLAIAFPLLNGLAVDRIYQDKKRIDEVVDAVKRLADLAEATLYPEARS